MQDPFTRYSQMDCKDFAQSRKARQRLERQANDVRVARASRACTCDSRRRLLRVPRPDRSGCSGQLRGGVVRGKHALRVALIVGDLAVFICFCLEFTWKQMRAALGSPAAGADLATRHPCTSRVLSLELIWAPFNLRRIASIFRLASRFQSLGVGCCPRGLVSRAIARPPRLRGRHGNAIARTQYCVGGRAAVRGCSIMSSSAGGDWGLKPRLITC